MTIVFLLIFLFNIFDYYSTINLLQSGATEINPLMNYALKNNSFSTIKLIIIPLLIIILIIYRECICNSKACKALTIFCFISYTLVFLYHIYNIVFQISLQP
ncbi:MAG: DUF5658 family protein [Halanaerobiales bacterium]